jgi:hypothetical protein
MPTSAAADVKKREKQCKRNGIIGKMYGQVSSVKVSAVPSFLANPVTIERR